MEKQLSQFREDLLTRIIRIYGFEHEITISIAEMLEKWENTEAFDKALETLVRCHEESPILD